MKKFIIIVLYFVLIAIPPVANANEWQLIDKKEFTEYYYLDNKNIVKTKSKNIYQYLTKTIRIEHRKHDRDDDFITTSISKDYFDCANKRWALGSYYLFEWDTSENIVVDKLLLKDVRNLSDLKLSDWEEIEKDTQLEYKFNIVCKGDLNEI